MLYWLVSWRLCYVWSKFWFYDSSKSPSGSFGHLLKGKQCILIEPGWTWHFHELYCNHFGNQRRKHQFIKKRKQNEYGVNLKSFFIHTSYFFISFFLFAFVTIYLSFSFFFFFLIFPFHCSFPSLVHPFHCHHVYCFFLL